MCRVYLHKLSIWETGIFGNFSVGGGDFVISKREFPVALSATRNSTYLGYVTVDRMSYREHLTKTAGKLKNRNNLLMKLAGSTWGASANTLGSSALALCYLATEYCAPVWSGLAHTSRDVQLNSTMRLISGAIRSTPLPWLLVLSNIEPPALRRKAATDKLVEKIVIRQTRQ